jgi:hypothetical protein
MDEPDPSRSAPRGLPADRGDDPDASATAAPGSAETTISEWRRRYTAARALLLDGEFAAAAMQLAELEKTATSSDDRAAAHALRTLADEWTARGLAFTRRPDLAPLPEPPAAPDRRSLDEIVWLYTNSVVYGIGSGLGLATITRPRTPAPAIVPAVALTAASVGTVIALETGPGFRYGVPQSIVTGMWIGFEHGLVWSIFADLEGRDGGRSGIKTSTASTIMWSFSTAGAIGGGVLGSVLPTTPGRSAWVGSTALWMGTLGGLTAGAVANQKGRPTTGIAVTGVGLTLGTGVGMLSAGAVSPSIARVRLIDLSAVLGGLTGAALYVAAASNDAEGQGVAGATALGIASGLAIGWLATSKMSTDRLRRSAPQTSTPPGEASEGARGNFLARMRPLLIPSQGGGAMMGAGGTLD